MSGITDPSEEYFKDGVWAWVSTAWKKLVADASSFLQVNIAAQDIDVEVKQQAAADLTPGVMGWDGSAWRKLPMVWGYSGQYMQIFVSTQATDGEAWLQGSTVPSGEIWVVTSAFALNTTSTITQTRLGIYDGGALFPALYILDPAAGESCRLVGQIVLQPGDKIVAYFEGCFEGDYMYVSILGYKMKVAE